jgi:hypothetical protein
MEGEKEGCGWIGSGGLNSAANSQLPIAEFSVSIFRKNKVTPIISLKRKIYPSTCR